MLLSRELSEYLHNPFPKLRYSKFNFLNPCPNFLFHFSCYFFKKYLGALPACMDVTSVHARVCMYVVTRVPGAQRSQKTASELESRVVVMWVLGTEHEFAQPILHF